MRRVESGAELVAITPATGQQIIKDLDSVTGKIEQKKDLKKAGTLTTDGQQQLELLFWQEERLLYDLLLHRQAGVLSPDVQVAILQGVGEKSHTFTSSPVVITLPPEYADSRGEYYTNLGRLAQLHPSHSKEGVKELLEPYTTKAEDPESFFNRSIDEFDRLAHAAHDEHQRIAAGKNYQRINRYDRMLIDLVFERFMVPLALDKLPATCAAEFYHISDNDRDIIYLKTPDKYRYELFLPPHAYRDSYIADEYAKGLKIIDGYDRIFPSYRELDALRQEREDTEEEPATKPRPRHIRQGITEELTNIRTAKSSQRYSTFSVEQRQNIQAKEGKLIAEALAYQAEYPERSFVFGQIHLRPGEQLHEESNPLVTLTVIDPINPRRTFPITTTLSQIRYPGKIDSSLNAASGMEIIEDPTRESIDDYSRRTVAEARTVNQLEKQLAKSTDQESAQRIYASTKLTLFKRLLGLRRYTKLPEYMSIKAGYLLHKSEPAKDKYSINIVDNREPFTFNLPVPENRDEIEELNELIGVVDFPIDMSIYSEEVVKLGSDLKPL